MGDPSRVCVTGPLTRFAEERLNKQIRRWTDVIGIFPNRDAIIGLVGAVLAEQNDEWTEASRYMGPEMLAACRKLVTGESPANELTIDAISAQISHRSQMVFHTPFAWT